jgi:putative ABC transport system permease protein
LDSEDSEGVSTLFLADVQTIMNAPYIARTADGDAAATADLLTSVNLPRRLDGSMSGVRIRAMTEQGFAVRPEIQIVEGRSFTPGLRELIVGRTLQKEFAGLGVGDRVGLRGGDWTIVGVFAAGTGLESALLADSSTLRSAYRTTLFNSVTVLLDSAESFDRFEEALETNPSLSVDVERETDYYARQTANLAAALLVVSYAIGGIMAVGALFAAMNTMYTAVSARTLEIATLRALGFGAFSVVASVLAEAMVLASAGGLAGAALAWLLLGGSTFSFGTDLGAVAAELEVTPNLLVVGLVWACAVGFVGGLLPALRVARLPVATAMRTT